MGPRQSCLCMGFPPRRPHCLRVCEQSAHVAQMEEAGGIGNPRAGDRAEATFPLATSVFPSFPVKRHDVPAL